ncbi:hypothetical protein K788_0006524 [Paraburkholderia caribensis MBA4]|uniref:Uncharacterized protein n=1 Tax=Paraburkholderia caribensis MBA4 TaxID=1323664 RepID=A0A0P0RBI7_9BURK|nr:hypothetical protein K788_0006524 [Paraburkholderia caribensis MBA4]
MPQGAPDGLRAAPRERPRPDRWSRETIRQSIDESDAATCRILSIENIARLSCV